MCEGMGFQGVEDRPWLWDLPPNNKLYYPLFELDIPFFTQVGHTRPRCPSVPPLRMRAPEPGHPIPYIDEIALAFPQLKIPGNTRTSTSIPPRICRATTRHNLFTSSRRMAGTRSCLDPTFSQLSWKVCMEQVGEMGLEEEIKFCS
ncbi:hypothetical protein BC936DRAFT_149215 [Jimgerdemannia flammicorona]|uniref:Uncharacterized protein n=1 Tax=Jimgerdemannia flammicorona TaxID=994334 RepID=A0A433D1B2_9FUNG|nr:hypothetical protein BC936DRAFT_149215 [Jimgerdemannia flammicorona]